jgi:hypothetical protein
MAARSPEERHTLSLALMGIAGSLLVGNFATFSTFVGLTTADRGVILALIGSSALLVASIVAGGRRGYDLQAKLGVLGVLISLVPPALAMTLRETVPDRTLLRIERLETYAAALAQEGADRTARLQKLEASARELTASIDRLEGRVSILEAARSDVRSP